MRPRVGIESERPVALGQVIEWVLANDPELAISRISLERAGYGIETALGHYDPVLGLEASKSKTAMPIASAIGGSASGRLVNKDLSFSPKVSGNLPWLGSTYSLVFSDSREESDSLFSQLNPQYPSSLTFNFNQPLWRGLRIDSGRRALMVSRKNRELGVEQLRRRVIERVTQAVQFYWELAYAWQNLDVQQEAVRLAEAQYGSNRRQAEQGLMAPIEVVAAETQVATFRQGLAAAQQGLTAAENNLKQMIASGPDDPLWEAALIPETPAAVDSAPPDPAEALRLALAGRPELAESAIQIDINGIDTRYYQDQKKPQVDAVATFAASGLAGSRQTANPFGDFPVGPVPEHLLGGNSQSLTNLWDGRYPTAKVGVQISLPLRNRAAAGNAAAARAEGRRLELLRRQAEMYVKADVRNAIEQWNSARVRCDAAEVARRAAGEQYDSERRQFDAGTSTMFLVFERQSAFISARSREVRARADLAEAAANLDRATARTLQTYRIQLSR